MPAQITVRLIRFTATIRGFRARRFTVVAHNQVRRLIAEAAATCRMEVARVSFKSSMDALRRYRNAISQARHQNRRDQLWEDLKTTRHNLASDWQVAHNPRMQSSLSCFAVAPAVALMGALAATDFSLRPSAAAEGSGLAERKLLYVAEPGIRNYLEYGGHGIIVFDVDHGHRFVKRIRTSGLDAKGEPLNVKGVCANTTTKRLYVSTTQTLTCLDLVLERILWEKRYEGGCDRMSILPNGKVIYTPSLEGAHWHVLDASSGEVIKKISPNSGAHNTIVGIDGSHAYLAGLKSPVLTVIDTRDNVISKTVGPFSNVIRRFTVNGSQTLCFVNVNDLLGFEVGDLSTGKMLHRVAVQGFSKGPTKRHGCPSHGIGMTPDEKEIWLTDAHNKRVHIFDATVMPPKQIASIELRDEPGWITFGIDGRYAYPSTGDVVETATRKIVAGLKDELGREVQSEKLLEIDFHGDQPTAAGDQFGLGRIGARGPKARAATNR